MTACVERYNRGVVDGRVVLLIFLRSP